MTQVLLALVLVALFGVLHVRAARLRSTHSWNGNVHMGIFDGLDDEIGNVLMADRAPVKTDIRAMSLAA